VEAGAMEPAVVTPPTPLPKGSKMSSPVTPRFLLEGAAYALEQCGLLLRDANILYRNGSYASTVVLTALAREELGNSTILLQLRKEALAGKPFTTEAITKRCDDHVVKQERGMLSIILKPDRASIAGKHLQVTFQSDPQSPEWQEANEKINKVIGAKRKRTPSDRHQSRESALYVGPKSSKEWNRPADTNADFARDFLNHAVNDYAIRYSNRYITAVDLLRHLDPELHNALEGWRERPTLLQPEWPPPLC
jgi:AbiV family abortive infection protein